MKNLLIKLRTMTFMLLALFFLIMFILTLLRHAWAIPFPKITIQQPFILVGLAIPVFLLFLGLHKLSLRYSVKLGKKFVSRLIIFYILIQVAFVLLFPVNAYEDALIVEKFAREFLKGDFSSFRVGHYLGYYPNNIGITLFFAFLYSFLPNSFITLRLCNVVFTTLSAWLTFKLYKELVPEKEVNHNGVLLLTIFFIPAIILNNFTYGDIICNSFCLAGLLYSIRFNRGGKLKHAVYTAVLLMLANFMRSVALLFLFGVLLYWFVNKIVKRDFTWKKFVIGSLLSVTLFNLPLHIFSNIGLKSEILQEPIGVHANPIWRWIDIGFPCDKRLGYWDGGKNASIFVNRFKCNRKMASKYFIEDIYKIYKKTGKNNVIRCYAKKMFWLWTEGTYSVNFYGLSQAVKPEHFVLYNTPLIKYIEPSDRIAHTTLDWLLHAYSWVISALIILYLFNAVRQKDYRLELFVYIIMLYLGFYLLWEVKSRYLFGLYPIFIIMSYSSIEMLYNKLPKFLAVKTPKNQ